MDTFNNINPLKPLLTNQKVIKPSIERQKPFVLRRKLLVETRRQMFRYTVRAHDLRHKTEGER